MLEQLASEVHEMRSRRPLRQFKPSRLRIASIGNCVVNKLNSFLIRQPGVDAIFCSNLANWGNYHRDTFLDRAQEADIVVALKSERGELIHSTDEIARQFGAKVIFVPVIWIEGLDTLQRFGERGTSRFSGGDPIAASIIEHGTDHTYRALTRGQLRTDPPGRLLRSLAELRSIEAGAIPIADYFASRVREIPLMNSIGHPTGELVLELFARLCEAIQIPIDREKLKSPLLVSQASLPKTPRIFSPFDTEELGLLYEADPDWMLQTKSILPILANTIRNGNYISGTEGADIV